MFQRHIVTYPPGNFLDFTLAGVSSIHSGNTVLPIYIHLPTEWHFGMAQRLQNLFYLYLLKTCFSSYEVTLSVGNRTTPTHTGLRPMVWSTNFPLVPTLERRKKLLTPVALPYHRHIHQHVYSARNGMLSIYVEIWTKSKLSTPQSSCKLPRVSSIARLSCTPRQILRNLLVCWLQHIKTLSI